MWFDVLFFFFQAEDGIRDLVRSRGLGDVYKRQANGRIEPGAVAAGGENAYELRHGWLPFCACELLLLSLIHI